MNKIAGKDLVAAIERSKSEIGITEDDAAALLAEKDKEIARLRVEKDRITKKLGMVQSQFAMKEEALIRDYVKSQTRKQHDIDLLSEKDAEIERLKTIAVPERLAEKLREMEWMVEKYNLGVPVSDDSAFLRAIEILNDTKKDVVEIPIKTDNGNFTAVVVRGAANIAEPLRKAKDELESVKSAREFECRETIKAIEKLTAENQRLREAIERTLAENLHLADGEQCTLWRLKQALAATAQGGKGE